LEKQGHTSKSRSLKWLTLETEGNAWIKGSHLEKNELHLEKGSTWKKVVTLGENGHNWKKGSHLEKLANLGKLGHI